MRYVVQTGGSNRDDEVIDAANEYGMVMAFANLRLCSTTDLAAV